MSKDKYPYPDYPDDLKRMERERQSGRHCERCGNSGWYKCPNLMTCGKTTWALAELGHLHMQNIRLTKDGREEVANIHAHPCDCVPSGGFINAKIRRMKMESYE